MKSFKQKVAVITGAGSGMGRYLAVLLAKDGADVCVCDVNEETLNETVAMLRKYNVSVSSHLLDVCLLYTSPSPRDRQKSRMPSSA